MAERWPQIKLWQGTVYGVFIWFAFHIVILPILGATSPPWNEPWEEHFSEFFGHAMWMWVIELNRRDLRNRMSHEPDAEVALGAPFR